MPKIPQNVLNTTFYLYPSRGDAEEGTNFGGTGFLVLVPSEMHGKYGRGYVYGVTNWHVACRGSSVIRLNTISGKPDIQEFGPEEWFFDPRYDVAVRQILIDPAVHKTTVISVDMLLTKDDVKLAEIGPGDDVFMLGRFMDHDGGRDINLPAARFGNISIDPSPIEQENGRKADCYCIDLHSRSGYSGSPVFVYRTPGSDLGPKSPQAILLAGANLFKLLGIHCAQFPEMWEVTAGGKLKDETSEPLLTDGRYIRGFSGMTVVIPAWVMILEMPTLKDGRANGDARQEQHFKKHGYPLIAENGAPSADVPSPATDKDPNHRENFNSVLREAVRKPESKD